MLHYVFSNCRINCFRKQRDLYRSVNITIVTTVRERHDSGLTQRFSMYPTNIFQALRDLKAYFHQHVRYKYLTIANWMSKSPALSCKSIYCAGYYCFLCSNSKGSASTKREAWHGIMSFWKDTKYRADTTIGQHRYISDSVCAVFNGKQYKSISHALLSHCKLVIVTNKALRI